MDRNQPKPVKYRIVECEHGSLQREEINRILEKFPMEYNFILEDADARDVQNLFGKGTMEVYHDARVIALYPENGKILSRAVVTDCDFPFRPDNMLDDLIGLRCCFHPKLTSFGITPRLGTCQEGLGDLLNQIEIDVHKFPKQSKDRRYEKFE